ncbi:MFS general substrate transporter [Periconia macrospinosa]|uniref:MFS general substrate transporter n=1 Tax=Periconia macrospinosa TaxID=97972 RepID=A0A2V1E4C3_9PLEO|nr:MFS general substrate transporter [Periconia macrospinosa]
MDNTPHKDVPLENIEKSAPVSPPSSEDRVLDQESDFDLLYGWRLHMTTLTICLSLFLASLEVSIVSTVLVSIARDLHNFTETGWIVSAYLLTYSGFLVIWAKISEIAGRKACLTVAFAAFVLFSGGCGAAQTSTQLITLRAFQGFGGSGMTSISISMLPEMVPEAKFPLYSSLTGLAFAFSYLLGPLLGGAINNGNQWRWVFLLNVPAGLITILFLHLSVPTNFPRHLRPVPRKSWLSRSGLRRIDFVGCFLLFGASGLLVASLEEAGLHYEWSSPTIIVLLVMCGLFWIGFVLWERAITLRQESAQKPSLLKALVSFRSQSASSDGSKIYADRVEPIFPWRFVKNRVFFSMLLCAFATGVPFTVCVITIPQRFQVINALSGWDASVRLLPFTVGIPVGSVIQSVAIKRGVPPIFVVLTGSLIQVAGTIPQLYPSVGITAAIYGEHFLTGFGVGINLGLLILWTPYIAKGTDTSVGMSSITQIRALGGVVGIAIVSNLFNNYLRQSLASSGLSGAEVAAVIQSAAASSALQNDLTRHIFREAYIRQVRVVVGFAAAQLALAVGMWRTPIMRLVGT